MHKNSPIKSLRHAFFCIVFSALPSVCEHSNILHVNNVLSLYVLLSVESKPHRGQLHPRSLPCNVNTSNVWGNILFYRSKYLDKHPSKLKPAILRKVSLWLLLLGLFCTGCVSAAVLLTSKRFRSLHRQHDTLEKQGMPWSAAVFNNVCFIGSV